MIAGMHRDAICQAASLDQKRQDIERRIDHLEERISGMKKSTVKVDDSRSKHEPYKYALADTNRVLQSTNTENLSKNQSQDQMKRLYDILKTTLEGQSYLQKEIIQLRQEMKKIAGQPNNSPRVKKYQYLKKESGSPAQRLYSNEQANGNLREISTSQFRDDTLGKSQQTAYFKPVVQPPTSKRQQTTKRQIIAELNKSDIQKKHSDIYKYLNVSSLQSRGQSPYVQKHKNTSRSKMKSAKNRTVVQPKSILKKHEPIEVLHEAYKVESRCGSESKSVRRSKRTRRAEIMPQTRSIYSKKIQKRLIDYQATFLDSEHKNAKHQHHHLTNTVELQKKLRDSLLCKILEMRDTKRYK